MPKRCLQDAELVALGTPLGAAPAGAHPALRLVAIERCPAGDASRTVDVVFRLSDGRAQVVFSDRAQAVLAPGGGLLCCTPAGRRQAARSAGELGDEALQRYACIAAAAAPLAYRPLVQ